MQRGAMRRQDRQMDPAEARQALANAFVGRLATVDAEGWPYAVPLLHVYLGPGEADAGDSPEGAIYVHNTAARGHMRTNVEGDPRACFEVDEPGPIFPYGPFACDTSIEYRSVIAFGRVSIVQDRAAKGRFYDWFMAKYAGADDGYQREYPRLDQTTVYRMDVERLTGKKRAIMTSGVAGRTLGRTPWDMASSTLPAGSASPAGLLAPVPRTLPDGAVVRDATPADFAAVSSLLAELGRPAITAENETAAHAAYQRWLQAPDARLLVVERAGRPVGCLTLRFRPRLNWATIEAWIPDLIVTESERGRGYGRALLDAAFALADATGCHRVSLESGSQRNAAHQLYLASGMTNTGFFFTRARR